MKKAKGSPRNEDDTKDKVYRPPAPEALLPPYDMTIEPWLISKELDKHFVQRLT